MIGGEYMLEVVFSDSAKGAMKAAKKYNSEVVAEGISKDVACIGLNLDIGDITGEIDSQERKKEFIRVFNSVSFKEKEIERFFKSQREDFEKLLMAAKSKEPIRVWRSNAPFSACAFAFLCNALENIECKISIIDLPEYWTTSDNTIQSCSDWSEVLPDKLHGFLHLEREITDMEKRLQSCFWSDLKAENAPLRALVNGKLISVPEDFYDHIIIKNIPENEFVMVQLIGTILGKYPLGIGDGWYALRIKKMIAENKLEIIENKDPSHPYGTILKKLRI
ncbi:MAG: DUF3658 domain-containing protein [Bacillota bacterium]|nr:DUF3658 domain-containing protein [Bacillota bacterium]